MTVRLCSVESKIEYKVELGRKTNKTSYVIGITDVIEEGMYILQVTGIFYILGKLANDFIKVRLSTRNATHNTIRKGQRYSLKLCGKKEGGFEIIQMGGTILAIDRPDDYNLILNIGLDKSVTEIGDWGYMVSFMIYDVVKHTPEEKDNIKLYKVNSRGPDLLNDTLALKPKDVLLLAKGVRTFNPCLKQGVIPEQIVEDWSGWWYFGSALLGFTIIALIMGMKKRT